MTTTPTTARLFRNGRSQAVRLPKEFRFSGTEVAIRREGTRVVLEPLPRREWPKGYFESWAAPELGAIDIEVPPALPPGGTHIDLDEPLVGTPERLRISPRRPDRSGRLKKR